MVDLSDGAPIHQAAAVLPRSELKIFISYRNGQHETHAHLLHARLIAAGFSPENVFIDLEQAYGVSFVEQIEGAGNDCDVLIGVVDPSWLETVDGRSRRLDDPNNLNRREIEVAMERGVTVIPVLVGGAAMPTRDQVPQSLAAFVELHAPRVSREPDGYHTLVKRLDQVAQEIATTKVFRVRAPNPAFVGREPLLDEIEGRLRQADGGTAVVAVVGLPALGKTQLAEEFAHRHSDDYRIIWELSAEQPAACREQFAALSAELKLRPRAGADPVAAVRTALERSRGRWLLILDNAKDEASIKDVVPRRGGHVLITSQRAGWDGLGAEVVPIDVLGNEEAVELLQKRLPAGRNADLEKLAETLMCIPLGLEQASALMRRLHLSVTDYLHLLRERAPDLLNEAPRDHERTLVEAWELSFTDVERTAQRDAPGAVELLYLCAFLAPDNVPLSLFAKHATALPEPVAPVVGDLFRRAKAVGLLADYSHVKWHADGTVGSGTVSLHRTVQHFARQRLGVAEQQTWVGAALSIVLAAFPEDPADVSCWETCTTLLPHATVALGHAAGLGVQPVLQARLLDRKGVFLKSRAQLAEAETALATAHALLDETDPEHRTTAATVRAHLGSLRADRGDFESAHTDLTAALAVHESVCGPESLEVAEDRLSLGRVLTERDDLAGAGEQFEKALHIRTELLGSQHPAVVDCLGALFNVRIASGNVLDARRYLKAALAVREALGQRDHPETVWLRFVDDQLFGSEAEPGGHSRLKEVISVIERAYTEEHPEIADWRLWLADNLLRELDLGGAEDNYRQALGIDEAAYGGNHWKVGRDLLRLFVIQAVRDETDVARDTLIRAVSILQRVASASGADGASRRHEVSIYVLAKFDEALDSLAPVVAAVTPFDRIRAVVADAYGRDSPLYASALEHLGAELVETERPDHLELGPGLLETALSTLVEHYGGGHRRVARCLRHLAEVQSACRDLTGAARTYAQALAIHDSVDLPHQIELMDVLTGFYLVLAAREKQAMTQTSKDTSKRLTSNPSDAASLPDEAARPTLASSRILERARDLATSSVGVGQLSRFAEALTKGGQLTQALELHVVLLGMIRETYGEQHPLVAGRLRLLGEVLGGLGDFRGALDRYDEALAIHRRAFGPDHETVAEDLRLRSLALARRGAIEAAARDLVLSLSLIDRLEGRDPEAVAASKLRQWVALGDALDDPDQAQPLYAYGLERCHEVPGAAVLRARLGAVAAVRDELLVALDHFRACASQHLADGGSDPFWTVVRDSSPAAHDAAGRRLLVAALCTFREDPQMHEHHQRFHPQLSASTPQGWLAKESLTLVAPDGQANVIASSEPLEPEKDTRQYAESQGDLLRREFPQYEEFQFEEIELFGDRRGWVRHFEWTPPEGVRVSQVQIYYAEDSRGYTATATTPTTNFDDLQVMLRVLISGLRIGR